MIGKYSLKTYGKALKENWNTIKENYSSSYLLTGNNRMRGLNPLAPETTILEMSVITFLLAVIIETFLWIYALMYLIEHYTKLPTWARVIAIMGLSGLLPGGSILTFAVIYFAK